MFAAGLLSGLKSAAGITRRGRHRRRAFAHCSCCPPGVSWNGSRNVGFCLYRVATCMSSPRRC